MGSLGHMGQYSVWPGTFWGFLNISLHVSSAQLGLDIVDQMCVHLRMGLKGFYGVLCFGVGKFWEKILFLLKHYE